MLKDKSTKVRGKIIEKSQPKLAFENTQPEPAKENNRDVSHP